MIVCEYLFKEFNTKGSDEYIDSWASHVDIWLTKAGKF